MPEAAGQESLEYLSPLFADAGIALQPTLDEGT